MLKSLLFSLKRFLSPESPLTRTADQTHPENTITAENQTSTEDDRYKALLRRLDSIESNLKAKQHIDDALKAFNAKTPGQVSMLSTGFTALLLALAGVGITYFSGQTEKFAAPVLAQARAAAAQGVGTEDLWGKAILAQEEERWQEALTYWQGVLETFPQDKTALFGASLAALQLAEKATGEERQRLWETAEKHFKAFPETQLTAAVLGNWGLLCQNRGEAATDSNKRERWFNKAEEKYRKATEADPNHAASWGNWGILCQDWSEAATNSNERKRWFNKAEEKYGKATEANPHDADSWFNWGLLYQNRGEAATDNDERERWFSEATEKYRKATEADPNHAASWGNWGLLCQNRGEAATDSNERERWFNKAEEKYGKATEANPHDADSWSNWGNLCAQRGIAATNSNEQERWFNEAAEKYRKGTEADPNHASSWNNWGVLCTSQGKAASDADAREHWYAEAEKKVARALEIAPRHVVYWFNKACLASLRQDVKACVDALEQWRDCKPDASSAELDNDPDFDNVRDTPEFQEFRKKLADNK